MNIKFISMLLVGMFLLTSFATASSTGIIKIEHETIVEENISNNFESCNMYEPHGIIHINGNDDFSQGDIDDTGVRNPEASGDSWEDAYIISNWNTPGVEIKNTDKYFIIENCYFERQLQNTIYFYSVENGKIYDCTIEPGRNYVIYLQFVGNSYIEKCRLMGDVSDSPDYIYMSNSPYNEISNCEFFSGCCGNCITMVNSNYNKIYECSFDPNVGQYFKCSISLHESNYNEIHDCDIERSGEVGIKLIDSDDNNIYDCEIKYCMNGIKLMDSSNDNTISFSTILYCNEFNDQQFGIQLDSGDNTIHHCEISSCDYGIKLKSKNNDIANCDISNCDTGIYSHTGSRDNTINHNNIFNNYHNAQAAIGSGSNNWDDGSVYGNYWDDYREKDKDKNGIGDDPYKISANNKDNFPLMARYGTPRPPTIDGPTKGVPGKNYEYTIITTDPDKDDVYYRIDWGDGSTSGWLGPYASGSPTKISHEWDEKEICSIKAMAKDTNDYESDWGPPLTMILDKEDDQDDDDDDTAKSKYCQLFTRIIKLFPLIEKLLSFWIFK